jgi:hypothetical protein
LPSGFYRLLDGDGNDAGSEQFRCAPGPMGWRYFATVQDARGSTNVDLSVDASWQPVRVRIQSPEHHLLVTRQGAMLDEQPSDIILTTATYYPSPGFVVAAARALGETSEVDVTAFDAELRAHDEHHRYELLGDEDVTTAVGTFSARKWRFVAPQPRFARDVWIAGDVAVAADGWFELLAYEAGGKGPIARA